MTSALFGQRAIRQLLRPGHHKARAHVICAVTCAGADVVAPRLGAAARFTARASTARPSVAVPLAMTLIVAVTAGAGTSAAAAASAAPAAAPAAIVSAVASVGTTAILDACGF